MDKTVESYMQDDRRAAVKGIYSSAARTPRLDHPFPMGRGFARDLGYPEDLLERLPPECLQRFTGVSNVAVLADLPEGGRALDLGCGAGVDTMLAAESVGKMGEVFGVDFSRDMLDRAREGAQQLDLPQVRFVRGDAESLPFPDETFHVIQVNGMFNLNPARTAIFNELYRILRPRGIVFVAELILREPLPDEVKNDPDNWFR